MENRDAFLLEFEGTVRRAADSLRQRSEPAVSTPLAPGGWSPKELVGHLIDSASNNHQRFVRAAFTDDLVFPGYDQDEWVGLQRYGELDWFELLALFESFNLHLVRVIAALPIDVLERERTSHNLDQIAWETVPTDQTVTLAYFVRDYLGHLKHHLHQLDPKLAPVPTPQRS